MAMAWAVVERAMKMQEVIVRALAGKLTWLQAADILDIDPRSLRRWRARYHATKLYGLFDRRHRPSCRKAPVGDIEQIVRLYRTQYAGFNARHFHHLARRDHGVRYSYTFVRLVLQAAGLIRKGRARGRHRRRREPRACFGELLHLDGSPHAWLSVRPTERQTLIAVVDDATKRLLYAQLWPAESLHAVMRALAAVFQAHGLPMALYTDRASWAFHTPKAGGRVAPETRTQLGRALAQLGIEHIPAYSPQARGRSERVNRTLQDRLVNELRRAGITTAEAANAYLCEQFVADYNACFARPAADPQTAFVPLGGVALDQILCEEESRTVGQDNVVMFDRVALQLAKHPARRTCAGLRVTVRRHLDGRHTVWRGPQGLGSFDSQGQPLGDPRPRAASPRRRARRLGPRSNTARGHWAQAPTSQGNPSPASSPTRRPRIRRGPRLPVGPTD